LSLCPNQNLCINELISVLSPIGRRKTLILYVGMA
jgi:hypothetical protein